MVIRNPRCSNGRFRMAFRAAFSESSGNNASADRLTRDSSRTWMAPTGLEEAGGFVFPRLRTFAMGLFAKVIKTMDDRFVHQLQDICYAEKQLVKALPKMADKATENQLKQGFLSHLEETRTHVQRLEEVFRSMAPK